VESDVLSTGVVGAAKTEEAPKSRMLKEERKCMISVLQAIEQAENSRRPRLWQRYARQSSMTYT
jgi:hypothetical protein